MSKSATSRLAEEKASLKRRKLVRRSRLRKAFAWVLASALTTQSLFAQNAQNAGSPSSGGLVNQMGASLQRLEQNGPGLFYYGVNGADRGLGYQGSYMTVGGFIPYAEDDMGGFWSADLRGHLSNYGGFFSNVGVVRQQFLGGALGTFGLYWDYDGDLNQYPTSIAGGNSFGHAYSQIGLSGALLTDFGNLRSNGYMPTGTTGFTQGSPGSPFYQNVIMAQYGLDAALTGVDLEVGAYIPGLADWAGMWSVGGYAFGNIKDKYSNGTPVVPNFGGVYSRIDVTLANNWDFQIQANNDSFFDWTGYARLTYRVGGSRRRSVADQIEQPPQRNEHIVRAHNTPIVAINPATGTPWRVIHVNNTSNSLGTAESPYPTLAQGNAAATNPWDIVFVDQGDGTATGYDTAFSFKAENQYLVGNGAAFYVPTANAGLINIATSMDGILPQLSNPAGQSIVIKSVAPGVLVGGVGGATIANFNIIGSGTGMLASGNLTSESSPGRETLVQNVAFIGNNSLSAQSGVVLESATGGVQFNSTSISNMTIGGFVVDKGTATVNYQGSITSDTLTNGGAVNPLIYIKNTEGAIINLAVGNAPLTSEVQNEISDTGGTGIVIENNSVSTISRISIGNVSLTSSSGNAITLESDKSTTIISQGTGSGIIKRTSGNAVSVNKGAPNFSYFGTIINARETSSTIPSHLLTIKETSPGGSVVLSAPPGTPFDETGDGIYIDNLTGGNVEVNRATIESSGPAGILVTNVNSANTVLTFREIEIKAATSAAIQTLQNPQIKEMNFNNLSITVTGVNTQGILVEDTAAAIKIEGSSSLNVGSTTLAAISVNAIDLSGRSSTMAMQFSSIISGVPAAASNAMVFGTNTSGTVELNQFLVNGTTKGTSLNYTNSGTSTITIP